MTSIYPSSTSSSSTSSANLLRISGMASGIDTDSVVKSMVSSYQTKIDKASQAKQLLQWKQEAYRDIIKDVKGLQEYFDPLSDKYILSGNSFNTNSVTNADSSIASVTANSSAKTGTYTVDVKKLAEQAKVESSSPLNSMVDISSYIDDTSSNVSLNLNSTSISLSGLTIDKVVENINSTIDSTAGLKGNVSASYVIDGDTSYIKFTKTGTTDVTLNGENINSGISSSSLLTDLDFDEGDISFTLTNGSKDYTIDLTVDDSTTVQDLIDKVNSATSGSVTMSIDDVTGKVSFQSKSYGSASSIKITDLSTSNNTITTLGISTTTTPITKTGTDAIVSITAPGQSAVTTTQSSNKFTTNGVTYNLVAEGTTTSTVTADSDTVVTNMKNFIKDYNSVIDTINTKLSEKKNSDYPPLTDAQKEEMSEDQITTWETKAKVGVLRNDDYLSSLMSQVRGIFSSPVYSSYNSEDTSSGKISLSFGQYGTNAIGIDTSSDISDAGKLVLEDETKLKSAIENNLDDFKKMFIGTTNNASLSSSQSYVGSANYMEDGIFKRMDTILRNYVAAPAIGDDGTYTLSGSMNIFVNKQYDYSSMGFGGQNTLPDQVYAQTVSISKLNTQMSDAETRYYAKFTALETAMNALNAQQSSLSSMLGTS